MLKGRKKKNPQKKTQDKQTPKGIFSILGIHEAAEHCLSYIDATLC